MNTNFAFYRKYTDKYWFSLTFNEQLGEVLKNLEAFLINKLDKENTDHIKKIFNAIDHLDQMKSDPKHKGKHYFRNLFLMKEYLCDAFLYDGEYHDYTIGKFIDFFLNSYHQENLNVTR